MNGMFIWFALMVLLLITEGLTSGLYTIWFSIGAMIAALCAAAGIPEAGQVAVFLIVSISLLLLLRPAARRFTQRRGVSATNADRVFERVGIVTEEIDNVGGRGAVYVDGKTWTARSYTGEPIDVDVPVTVNMIDGVKLVVTAIKQEPESKEPAEHEQANQITI